MHDFRDLADEALDPDLDNDTWCELHALASQITSIPDDGPGPVSQDLRNAVSDAFTHQSDYSGPEMIPDSEFEDYTRELARDVGAFSDDAPWPARCIDWEQAADELKQDYTCYTFHGEDHWTRA